MGQPTRARRAGAAARMHRAAGGTRGTETSQYPEEQKSSEIPVVAASEAGDEAQTGARPEQGGGPGL
jgi:hypothetical protein